MVAVAGVKGTGAPKEDMGSAEEVNAEMVVAGEAVVPGSEAAAKVAVAVVVLSCWCSRAVETGLASTAVVVLEDRTRNGARHS